MERGKLLARVGSKIQRRRALQEARTEEMQSRIDKLQKSKKAWKTTSIVSLTASLLLSGALATSGVVIANKNQELNNMENANKQGYTNMLDMYNDNIADANNTINELNEKVSELEALVNKQNSNISDLEQYKQLREDLDIAMLEFLFKVATDNKTAYEEFEIDVMVQNYKRLTSENQYTSMGLSVEASLMTIANYRKSVELLNATLAEKDEQIANLENQMKGPTNSSDYQSLLQQKIQLEADKEEITLVFNQYVASHSSTNEEVEQIRRDYQTAIERSTQDYQNAMNQLRENKEKYDLLVQKLEEGSFVSEQEVQDLKNTINELQEENDRLVLKIDQQATNLADMKTSYDLYTIGMASKMIQISEEYSDEINNLNQQIWNRENIINQNGIEFDRNADKIDNQVTAQENMNRMSDELILIYGYQLGDNVNLLRNVNQDFLDMINIYEEYIEENGYKYEDYQELDNQLSKMTQTYQGYIMNLTNSKTPEELQNNINNLVAFLSTFEVYEDLFVNINDYTPNELAKAVEKALKEQLEKINTEQNEVGVYKQ